MSASLVEVRREGAVATVVMNRPPVNAISHELLGGVLDAVGEAAEDRGVRCIVIASALDRYFMAGADLNAMSDRIETGDGSQDTRATSLAMRLSSIEAVPKPVVAAVNGHALGGGCELALCCDYRLMVDDGRSTIGLSESTLGLIPGGGGTQRLPRLVGRARGLQMIIEGTRLRAPDALAIGLVDAVFSPDDFAAGVAARAEHLATLATRAVGAAKAAVLGGLDLSLEEGLRLEAREFTAILGSADAAEGVGAFLEKRRPAFRGE